MKVRDTNHVADVHDLCPPTFPVHCNWLNSNGFVADLSRTLSKTSRHVEMVCVRDFRDLCPRLSRGEVSVKVGVMEFKLNAVETDDWMPSVPRADSH